LRLLLLLFGGGFLLFSLRFARLVLFNRRLELLLADDVAGWCRCLVAVGRPGVLVVAALEAAVG
jgi:hypothetical protein